MLNTILGDIRQKAAEWERKVAEQRAVSTVNPIADAVEWCAKDLRELARVIEQSTEEVSPEQFAELQGVSAETVRAWIRKGRLAARETARGYRIRRDAHPIRKVG